MTPSSDLYELIHSLTSTEKRYVRQTALISGRNTAWLRLFDVIDRQKAFDEEELRTILKGDPMLGNLSVAKRYVYNAVLRALQAYGVGRDFDSEIGEMIEGYKVLYAKSLHTQAARMLRDIKRRALAGDAYLRLYWTNIQDYRQAAQSTEHASMDRLEDANIDRQQILRCIQNYSFVGHAYFQQRSLLRLRPNARCIEEQEELHTIIAPLLEMQEEDLLTPTASGMYHLALGDYWEAMGEPELARPHFDRFLDPARLDMEIGASDTLHLIEFTNALVFRLRHLMTEDLDRYVEALRKKVGRLDRRGRSFTVQVLFYERWLVTSLMLLNLVGEIAKAAKLLHEEGERVEQLWGVMSKKWRLQLLLTTAAIRLAQGNHAEAIDALNSVLNDSESSTDEYGAAMLLALVAHVEAGNIVWLDAAFRSATRHLTSRDRYHETEKAMIAGLRRVVQARDEGERRAAFLHLNRQLQKLFNDPRERTALVSLDLLLWTEAHATGVPFAALIAHRELESRKDYSLHQEQTSSALS
jgi:tetratricopeptide (TPR) repeat protein